MTVVDAVPEGFASHDRKSPVTDPWEPLFARQRDGVVELGLVLRPAHCNSRGFVHGGVIAALADNATGLSAARRRAPSIRRRRHLGGVSPDECEARAKRA